MNFTREPIIETVITPPEGSKLVIRPSKGNAQEDYYVDAVEIVAFGSALFFRSLERPKSFLVPVSDYEVIEVKETKMVLKTTGLEKTIKIAGGKEQSNAPAAEKEDDRKKDKRRQLRRRRGHHKEGMRHQEEKEKPAEGAKEVVNQAHSSNHTTPVEQVVSEIQTVSEVQKVEEEPVVSTSVIRKLFPPPSTLIKEKLVLTKGKEESFVEENSKGEGKHHGEQAHEKHVQEEKKESSEGPAE